MQVHRQSRFQVPLFHWLETATRRRALTRAPPSAKPCRRLSSAFLRASWASRSWMRSLARAGHRAIPNPEDHFPIHPLNCWLNGGLLCHSSKPLRQPHWVVGVPDGLCATAEGKPGVPAPGGTAAAATAALPPPPLPPPRVTALANRSDSSPSPLQTWAAVRPKEDPGRAAGAPWAAPPRPGRADAKAALVLVTGGASRSLTENSRSWSLTPAGGSRENAAAVASRLVHA
jgi:hypothetical protein